MKRDNLYNAAKCLPWIMLMLIVSVMLLGFAVSPVNADTGSTNPETSPALDNTQCLGCHGQPGQVTAFPNNEPLFITIDQQIFADSVHGMAGLECTQCHVDITGYPHPLMTEGTRRNYTLSYQDTCKECHEKEYSANHDSIHGIALQNGNINAPTCVDCHNPHAQNKIHDAEGNIYQSAFERIPNVCARCHNAIYEQYAQSVHGSGVLDEGNSDSPTCIACHNVHNISDPKTTTFRLNSPEMCATCHVNKEMMDKYGLNTAVLDTYVADFHGTTAVLFDPDQPDQQANIAVCYDCHGVHDISRVDDPKTGIQLKENLMVKCQACHPDAQADFPTSWLGHYIPTKEATPLLFYVQWFYRLLIPFALGAMLFINFTDILHRLKRLGKKTPHVEEENKDAGGDA